MIRDLLFAALNTQSGGGGTGPGATSSFITADFTSPTGTTILPQLWGVAMAGTAWGSQNYGSNAWINAVQGLNFQFVRQHLEDLFGSIFSSYNATPNWSVIAPWVQNFRTAFPNAMLQVGGAWPVSWSNNGNTTWTSASQTDINGYVSMWSQLANYLTSQGITVSIWDGVFNEPDVQGVGSGTSIDPSVVATISAAVFNALAGINSGWKFSGPCTAWWNPGYWQALQSAYSNLSYTSFHFYNPNGYNFTTGVPDWTSLITNAGTIFEGNSPAASSSNLGCMNEYNINGSQAPPNGTMTDAVWCAVMLMVAGTLRNVPIGGYWQVSQDGSFPGVDSSGTIAAPMYLLSKAGQHVAGTAVSCTNPGSNPNGSTNVYTLACKNSSAGFGVLLSNYGTTTQSGTLALSHWPVNSTGNGTVNMWQHSGSNIAGTTSQVSVTAGITSSISLPAMSNTIVYV